MKRILILGILFSFASPAFANTTGYAWSESLGWFDFSNVIVTDTEVTGYAYNDNTGWLSFEDDTTVTNTDGTLGGYAWSESLGWFDFSNVYIEDNVFGGYAYNDNTGWLSFEDDTTVATTWAPAVAPTEQPRSSSRSGSRKRITTPITPPSVNTPTQTPGATQANTPVPTVLRDSLSSNPRDLEINTEGEDVMLLQKFLNAQGFSVNTPGQVGSAGYETAYFGSLTRQALIKFQQANGINPSAGYFGPITRAFIGTLLVTN